MPDSKEGLHQQNTNNPATNPSTVRPQEAAIPLPCGRCLLDANLHKLRSPGHKPEDLGRILFPLLKFFIEHEGRSVTFDELWYGVWMPNKTPAPGPLAEGRKKTVDVNVARLREKLASQGCGAHIDSVRGAGFALIVDPPADEPGPTVASQSSISDSIKAESAKAASPSPPVPSSKRSNGTSAKRHATPIGSSFLRQGLASLVSQRWLILLLVSLLTVLVCSLALFSSWNKPVRIAAELTNFSDIQLRFYGQQDSGYSPLVGWSPYNLGITHEPDGTPALVLPEGFLSPRAPQWQGLVYPTKAVKISTSEGRAFTSYMISTPLPVRPTHWEETSGLTQVSMYLLPTNGSGQINIRTLDFSRVPSLAKCFEGSEHMVRFLTNQPINVELIGDKTIASWIPAEDSTIRISRLKDTFHNTTQTLQIAETSTDYSGRMTTQGSAQIVEDPMGFPIAEFAGSRMIFWNQDKDAVLDAFTKRVRVKGVVRSLNMISGANTTDFVVALVVIPRFSIRVAIDSATASDIELLNRVPEGRRATPFFGGRKGMTATAAFELIGKSEFADLHRAVLDNPLTTEERITQTKSQHDGRWLGKAYPPMPDLPAIFAYGQLNRLHFQSASGKLGSGANTRDVSLAELDISHFESSAKADEPLSLTVENEAEHDPYTRLSGYGNVTINHERIRSWSTGQLALLTSLVTSTLLPIVFWRKVLASLRKVLT